MTLRKGILGSNDYTISISEEVFTDVDEILYWYKLHGEKLWDEFYENLIFGLNSIQANPKGCQKIYKNVRRYLMKKFPYSIIYNIDEINLRIIIITVFHNSRNPEIWKERAN